MSSAYCQYCQLKYKLLFFLSNSDTFHQRILSNCNSQGFNSHNKKIWREWISLSDSSFKCKVIRGDTIVNNTALSVFIESHYRSNKIRPKLNDSRHLGRKFRSKISEAFWKSIKIKSPGIFYLTVKSIMPRMVYIVSQTWRLFINPI